MGRLVTIRVMARSFPVLAESCDFFTENVRLAELQELFLLERLLPILCQVKRKGAQRTERPWVAGAEEPACCRGSLKIGYSAVHCAVGKLTIGQSGYSDPNKYYKSLTHILSGRDIRLGGSHTEVELTVCA